VSCFYIQYAKCYELCQLKFIRATNFDVKLPRQKLKIVNFNDCDEEGLNSDGNVDPKDITTLEIVDQNVLYLPINLLILFPNIKKLVVKNSKLIEISKEEFNGFNGLLEVAITKNNLVTLPSNTFAQSLNLKTIDISSNKLNELPSGFFSQLRNLQSINASSNVFTELKHDLFASQNNITELNFRNNKITKIDQRFFRNLKKLQIADFRGNVCIDLLMPEDVKLPELTSKVIHNCK